jgi:protein gp37
MRLANRFSENGWSKGLINPKNGKWNGVVRLAAHKLADPLRWREPSTVFTNSMSDLFHESLTNEQIAAVFGVMAAAPRHTFQCLTKRAKRMREWFEWVAEQKEVDGDAWVTILREAACLLVGDAAWDRHARENVSRHGAFDVPHPWPLPWVWLGVSAENQEAADERIPELMNTPASVRFVSCEPLISAVNLRRVRPRPMPIDSLTGGWGVPGDTHRQAGRINWVIAGVESGPGARSCDVEWLRALRDQCTATDVPYFLKQATPARGSLATDQPNPRPINIGKGSKWKAGSVIELPYLDGAQHSAFPVSP